MRKIFLSSILASVLVSGASVAVWSQQDSAPNVKASSNESISVARQGEEPDSASIPLDTDATPNGNGGVVGQASMPWGLNLPTPFSVQDQADLKKFSELISKLRATKDESARQKLLEDIRGEVARQFDKDIAARQQDLDGIEQRLLRIRTQLEASRANRETNINTIVSMIESPNAGLGLRREWIDAIVNQSNQGIGTNISISGDGGLFSKAPGAEVKEKVPTYPSAADYNEPAKLNDGSH